MTSKYNKSTSSKNWLHYASNCLARPTSIANTASLLAMPINSTHCMPMCFSSCAQPSTIHWEGSSATYACCCCSSHLYANRCGCRCNLRLTGYVLYRALVVSLSLFDVSHEWLVRPLPLKTICGTGAIWHWVWARLLFLPWI